LTTDVEGFSTAVKTDCGATVYVLVLPPPAALISTMTISAIATTATLEMVTTVGDCQGGRRSSEIDRAAA
jgi:hypothetical protein